MSSLTELGPSNHPREGALPRRPGAPMLFTTVIDALNSLMLHAMEAGILRRLTSFHIALSVSLSLYTDDVAIFCHPSMAELTAVPSILHVFGHASGLHTNFAKCSTTPIHCIDDEVAVVSTVLACPLSHFHIPYLGLSLSVQKVPASALQPLVDHMVKKLSTWRASMLSRGERLTLVRHVLTAMPTHLLMIMVICQHVLKCISRIIRDFLWHGRRDVNSGH